MRFGKIRASSRTTHIFGMLRATTGLPPEVLARFSLCLSLGQRGVPNPDEYNRDGSEMSPDAVFGGHEKIYMALVRGRIRADGLDPGTYLDEMIRAHLNRGAIGLKQRVGGLADFEKMISEQIRIAA